jgi:hypothetical protein
MKITITENDLHSLVENIVSKLIEGQILEDRIVHDDGYVEIDNFDTVSGMLKFNSPDDVYFVQIIKRHKDNMDQYFANNAADYITYYLFNSLAELNSKKEEIKAICDKTNSRAYIYLNPRSAKAINDYANNVLKDKFRKIRALKYKQGHEIEVAAGQSKDWDDRSICFIDVDSDDENVYKMVAEKIKNAGITPIATYRTTNNGWHIIIGDKEKAKTLDFSDIDGGRNFGRFATVSLEIDKATILYCKVRPNGYGVQQSVQRHKARR